MPPIRLTNSSIRTSCPPPATDEVTASGKPVLQRVYMDAELRGFGVIVTRTSSDKEPTRTFFIQREVDGRTVRVKIGRLGDISADEARRRAQVLVADLIKGTNPNVEKRKRQAYGVTLEDAALAYREKPAKRTRTSKSPLTLDRHDYYADVLKDWASRPLREISRADVLARHKRLTVERGDVAANNALRWFRSVYNAALLVHEDLPPNPCFILTDYWNREKRKRSPIPWSALPEWLAWVKGELRERNPVRADLQLFLLFSGLRRTDACSISTDEISIPFRKLHRPKPKGGEDYAFDVPLSEFLAEIVDRRMKSNGVIYGPHCRWLFPTFDRAGRVKMTREPKEDGRPSPHRLRDTYATAAHEAGVAVLDQKILMNHRLPGGGDVTEGYQRPSWEHLVRQQERITSFLREKMRTNAEPKSGGLRLVR